MASKISFPKKAFKQMLEEIETEQGIITPKEVLRRAQSVDSPIHALFDWNDTSAAAKYRLHQARLLIREITIEWQGAETKGYWSATIEVEEIPVKGYFSTARLVTDKAIYNAVLKDAVRELKYWDKKYKEVQALGKIINKEELERIEQQV